MIQFLRSVILAILLIWAILVVLQIDPQLGLGDLIIVLCLGGIYYFLGKVFVQE